MHAEKIAISFGDHISIQKRVNEAAERVFEVILLTKRMICPQWIREIVQLGEFHTLLWVSRRHLICRWPCWWLRLALLSLLGYRKVLTQAILVLWGLLVWTLRQIRELSRSCRSLGGLLPASSNILRRRITLKCASCPSICLYRVARLKVGL